MDNRCCRPSGDHQIEQALSAQVLKISQAVITFLTLSPIFTQRKSFMNLSWKIAWRYIFGKKSTNAIQIITGISIFGLGFGTAAIILILSVFNGFETLLLSMFDAFNPDIKIELVKGKHFAIDKKQLDKIYALDGVEKVSLTIEELALFQYDNRQEVGTLKGVDDSFNAVTGMDTAINRGAYLVQDEGLKYGLFGLGMAYKLGLNLNDRLTPVSIYLPNAKKSSPMDKQFSTTDLYPGGTFAIQQDVDYEYVVAPISAVQALTKKYDQYSAIEIKKNTDVEEEELVAQLQNIVGEEMTVMGRFAQQASTVKVMRIEKWLSLVILILALILVAFNLIGAIWMIVMDKKKDLGVLQAMGARKSMIRNLIFKIGSLICLIGISIGFVLAFAFYYIHKTYGIISMGEQAIIDSYPMELFYSDLPIVAAVVLVIGFMAVVLPAIRASASNI